MIDTEQFSRLVNGLRLLPAETPWVEYKQNNTTLTPILDKIKLRCETAS